MIASPVPANGASDIRAAPAPARASADQPMAMARGALLRLHNTAAMATNHTSTDRSTCTTSATRKKSATGSHWFSTGVRDNTSNTEKRPEPTSASRPSHNHARASVRRAPSATASV